MVETVLHLFFECDFSYKVWMECLRWWGIHSAFLNECRGHLFQFVGLIGTHKNNLQLWKVVWFATIWEIWKMRNGRLFNDTEVDIQQLVE